jgi:hypothetical protein
LIENIIYRGNHMSLIMTFMELDKLYESTDRMSRAELIKAIKAMGFNYNFDKYSDEALYRILKNRQSKVLEDEAYAEASGITAEEKLVCDECGCQLTDGGFCPKCENGEEDY